MDAKITIQSERDKIYDLGKELDKNLPSTSRKWLEK